jgi:hypothetical protein
MVFACSLEMSQGMRLVRFEGDESKTLAQVSPPQVELAHFRNVTGNVVQDALNAWSDIWGELEGNVACGVAVTPEDGKGFTPSCGWPAFLEKMWVLRQNLDFLSRSAGNDTKTMVGCGRGLHRVLNATVAFGTKAFSGSPASRPPIPILGDRVE